VLLAPHNERVAWSLSAMEAKARSQPVKHSLLKLFELVFSWLEVALDAPNPFPPTSSLPTQDSQL
jgi:hypothetical protein